MVWAIRWLAADPEAALTAVDDERIVPDEIAEDLDHWLEVCRGWNLIDEPTLAILDAIDQAFSEMSGLSNAENWTPEAVRTSEMWLQQRMRARDALTQMGEARADERLRGQV